MVAPVTAAMIYDLVACPHRVTMDLFADPAQRDESNPFVELLWEKDSLYEHEVIAGLQALFLDLSPYAGDEKERLTLEAMQKGEVLIYGGRIQVDGLLGDEHINNLVFGTIENRPRTHVYALQFDERPEDSGLVKRAYQRPNMIVIGPTAPPSSMATTYGVSSTATACPSAIMQSSSQRTKRRNFCRLRQAFCGEAPVGGPGAHIRMLLLRVLSGAGATVE